MKKTIIFILTLILGISLITSCGDNKQDTIKKVEEKLNGNWSYTISESVSAKYNFNNGKFTCTSYASGLALPEKSGTYTIDKDGNINLVYDSGTSASFQYKWNGNELMLSNSD